MGSHYCNDCALRHDCLRNKPLYTDGCHCKNISDTAEFGEYVSGPRVLPAEQVKANMRAVLSDIQDGTFAGRWIAENKNGRTFFNSKRSQLKKHQMEIVGEELRKNMIWGGDTDLDTASN